MPCRRTRSDLPAYLDGALDGAADTAVREHLSNCDACSAELARERELLALLDRQKPAACGPQLWSRVRGGLAQTIGCEEARRLLPPLLDQAVFGAAAVSLAAHLDECPPCAREEKLYRAAASALATAPAAEVDLWPQFERRLAEEALRPAWPQAFVASMLSIAPRPLALTALAAAAFFFGGHWLQLPAPRSGAGTTVARAVPRELEPQQGPSSRPVELRMSRAARKHDAPVAGSTTKAAPAAARRVRPRPRRAVQNVRRSPSRPSAPAPVRQQPLAAAPPVVVAARPGGADGRAWSSMLHVEFPGSAVPPVSRDSGAAAAPEVVRAVSLLAEATEATLETFE